MIEIHQADAIHLTKGLPDASVDLIVMDPAYASLEKHRSIGTTTRLKKWFPIFPDSQYGELLHECYRALKKNTHMYIFCDDTTRDLLKPIALAVGFKYWKCLVWDKKATGMGYHYRAGHEYIMFLEKGRRPLNTNKHRDVLPVAVSQKRDKYPTEKPVELLEILISESSAPNEIVFDPFMGSGATAVAAQNLGRNFLGGDIEEKSVLLAKSRTNK